jgi:hypothetical protein
VRFLCKWGIHDWHWEESRAILQPKCGPFDPRSPQARIVKKYVDICCQCGQERVYDEPSIDPW